MKRIMSGIIILLMTGFLSAFALEAVTNHLAIYLLPKGADGGAAVPGKAGLGDAKLFPEPVLADRDFVTFDTSNHTFTVTPETAARLARKLKGDDSPHAKRATDLPFDWPDTGFVLKACGQPVYQGVFTSCFSSMMYSEPAIMAEEVVMSTRATNNLLFKIDLQLAPRPPQSGSPLTDYPNSALARPSAQEFVTDVRDDKRILQAARELFAKRGGR